MTPDPIPEDGTATAAHYNHSMTQLHKCVEGLIEILSAQVEANTKGLAEERAITRHDVQEERHRAKNVETIIVGQIDKTVKTVNELRKLKLEQRTIDETWRTDTDEKIGNMSLDMTTLKSGMFKIKESVGANKPGKTLAAMSQRSLAIWSGGGIFAALAAGPTIVKELAIIGHSFVAIFTGIGAIH